MTTSTPPSSPVVVFGRDDVTVEQQRGAPAPQGEAIVAPVDQRGVQSPAARP